MAKYDIVYSCGHEGTVQLTCSSDDRKKRIGYFTNYGLCPDCYKKMKLGKEKEKGFVFHAAFLPYIDERDGSLLLSLWFDGDTMPHKEDIKAIGGYKFSELESVENSLSYKYIPKVWNKTVKINELESEMLKAKSAGAVFVDVPVTLANTMDYHMALDKQKRWKEEREKINALQRPVRPSILGEHRWNEKVYGKAGQYSVYLSGVKTSITDREAEELDEYVQKRKEYMDEIKKIRS